MLAKGAQTSWRQEGQRIGGDYVQNVTAAIAASAPQGAEIAGAAIEGIVRDMTARGFSEDQAREVASLYWGQVARGLADKRPDLENAGLYMSQAVAAGIVANQHLVGTAAQDLATTAGAILKASGGDLKKGLADALNVAGQTGFSANATASLVAEFEQQAHAAKSLEQVLGTLAPAQRAVYDITVQQAGPMAALTALVKDGVITQEQYTAMLQGGALAQRTLTEAQARATEAALGGAVAVRDHADALAREHEAALGGAVAIRAHEEALTQQKEAALGGAVAIRQHGEDLAREKDAALGGALAIRSHSEDLAREKEAALGGALAIRDHEEALARQKEEALGGALAIREHSEQLQRDKDAALGGVAAIRDHEEALQPREDGRARRRGRHPRARRGAERGKDRGARRARGHPRSPGGAPEARQSSQDGPNHLRYAGGQDGRLGEDGDRRHAGQPIPRDARESSAELQNGAQCHRPGDGPTGEQ
jgi:hypothetical protein